ncbi:hypothetical protein [Azospirillum argentinense]
MKANIRDFQVVERADLEIKGITLVAGRNSQGKSSIAKGLAVALTGTVQLGGLLKKDGGKLVRAGCTTAYAVVQSESGKATASWPKCEFITDGTPPAINAHAAGLEHLVDMAPKDRATFLARALHTAPDKDDLLQAFTDAGIPAPVVEKVWADIEAIGWDGKAADVKDKGARFKGRWEGVTGEKYGSEKAKGWLPKDWTADLTEAELDDLSSEVGEAQIDLEKAIAGAAVDQSEIDRLTAACADIESLHKASMDAEVAASQAEAAYKTAKRELDDLPPAQQPDALACPCCKAALQVNGHGPTMELVQAAMLSEADLKKRQTAIDIATGNASHAKKQLDAADQTAADAQRAHQAAHNASQRLAELKAKGGTGSAADVQAARDRLALAQRRHAALKAKFDADELSKQLAVNALVQTLLSPEGLRKAKLLKVLDTFNGGPLAELCAAAGWQPVRIEPDLSVTYGGRAYPLLSGLGPQLSSDQFRVRAVLQVALAQMEGHRLVIIDAADVLDHLGRGGLIQMLRAADVSAVVCMTFGKPDLVPDLQAAGMGLSYWIDGGIARPLAEVKAVKQEAA